MDLLYPRNNVSNFNFNWKFYKGDVVGAQNSTFGDETWHEVDIPHDWSIEGPFDSKWASCTGYLPGGIGWYRKRFTIPTSNENKKVFIYFEGVYNNSEVWINGVSLGKRPNGYISFYYEISEYLHLGGENVIAVKVDHTKYADSRWYTGSGIYRNVKLIITNGLHIKLWGVYAHASLSGLDHGLLEVNVTIANENSTSFEAEVINELFYQGEIIGQTEQTIYLAGNDESVIQGEIEVQNPKLWDLEDPEFYSLISSIKIDDQILDQVETRVGFREIHFDSNQGFFLNGKNMKFKGICMHHDAGCLGAAVPADVLSRRLDILKKMGCNAIRTSHNAFSPEFYDLCDKKGFLVIDEIFDEWELPKKKWIDGWNVGTPGKEGYAEHFDQWAKIDLRDQILRDRNHPCIIMWSIGNEIDFPNDPYSHEILNTEKNPQIWAKFDENLPHANRLGEVAKELVNYVRNYDKNRPVTAGLASALMSNEVGYADALDVVGYNYQEFRYKSDHEKYPNRILYGSENSITFKAWRTVEENDFIMGQFLWTGIEYLGEAGKYPTRQSRHGLIDLTGHKKPEFYFRQSLWSENPMVFMGISELNQDFKYSWEYEKIYPHWNWNPGQLVKVTVFSNCQEVELISNNKSYGTKQMKDSPEKKLNWEITFESGELHAIARNNDEEVASSKLRTAGEPTQIILKSDKLQIKANNHDVAHIDVIIADEKGIPVYSANNKITCQVSGPIRLLGLEDANPNNIEDYKDSQQNAFKGRLMIYVQSLDQTGKGKIILSSSGLKGAELQLNIV